MADAAAWSVASSVPGRLRAAHPIVHRNQLAGEGLRRRLLAVNGVRRVTYNPVTSRVLVTFDQEVVFVEQVLAVLAEAVLDEELLVAGIVLPELYEPSGSPARRNLVNATANIILASAAQRFPALGRHAAVATAGAAWHILWSALKAIFVERKIRVDILDAIVILLLLANGWTFAAAAMTWLLDFGDWILDSASRSSRQLISQVFGEQKRTAWKQLPTGEELEVAVGSLRLGDQVVVRAGEQIPVDGVVVRGTAMVDQHVLSGEHAPVDRGAGEKVYGMTTVLAGHLVVEVRETLATSNAAQIVKIIEETLHHRVQVQYLSERFADAMVVPTLGIGAVGYWLSGPPAMVAILNADYGTGIRVACPLALVTSLTVAARRGIVIKNGRSLETLREIDAVVFDKTGTLTREVPEVADIASYRADLSPERVLTLAACAEQRSSHPIARAVLAKARELAVEVPRFADSAYHVGFGLEIDLDGHPLKVGSRRFMEMSGEALPQAAERDLAALGETGRSAVLVSLDREVVGLLTIRASEREEASRLIANLRRRQRIRDIVLVSGDHLAPTRAFAEKLGIADYHAEMLPEQKAAFVRKLQEGGRKVAMVGDGINDSVALSAADCSISISGASNVALEVADVVFTDGDFAKFDQLFEISDRLNANVRRSFALAVVPNSVLIGGALVGWFGIGSSIVLNNAFNLMAALNGLLPYWSVLQGDKKSSIPPAS